ncbi:MAG: C40 family peptidase [Acidobacteriia bacterium]|nr:C40 family peptidase [Terriglobia bacterium]
MPGIAVMALFAASLPNAVVLQPVANMYSKPSPDADVVSQAIYGANVGILDQQEGWARIRTPDDYTGWVPASSLRAGAAYAAAGRVAEVRSLFAHLYREADVTRHAPLLTVPFETRLEAVSDPKENGRWISVRLPDDRSGWVQTADVNFDPKPLSIPEMLEFSKRFLGLPYTWGGTSSYGYDCSGFVQMLERRRGVLMPRDAQPQADWSGVMPVERKDLRPGDLLYFGSSAQHITHTGMYLGEGKFIDATTYETPMVRIDDLENPRWTKLLVAMRRVK